jgi:hypothetical protein
LAVLEHRLQEKLKPYEAQLTLLDEIPGVDWTLAAVIIAEMGVDMSVFGSVSQLASWAGVCPGNNESAGKRKSSRIPKGNVYLKTALVEAANAAAKAKGTYLRDKFYRLKARRGYKRAAVAVAHKILVAIYHMFSHQVCYNELGDAYLDISNNVGSVNPFFERTSFFSPKRVFLFRFFLVLSSLHRRPRLVRNLAVGFSPTQTSHRSKLRP